MKDVWAFRFRVACVQPGSAGGAGEPVPRTVRRGRRRAPSPRRRCSFRTPCPPPCRDRRGLLRAYWSIDSDSPDARIRAAPMPYASSTTGRRSDTRWRLARTNSSSQRWNSCRRSQMGYKFGFPMCEAESAKNRSPAVCPPWNHQFIHGGLSFKLD